MGNQYQEPDYWSRKAFSEGYPARSKKQLASIHLFAIIAAKSREKMRYGQIF